MKKIVLAAALLFSALFAAPALAQNDDAVWSAYLAHNPDYTCRFSSGITEVTLKDLPPALRAALPRVIADVRQPFNNTDYIIDSLPRIGVVRAGHRGTRWFVWTLEGSIVPQEKFWLMDGNRVAPPISLDIQTRTLCTDTDNFLKYTTL